MTIKKTVFRSSFNNLLKILDVLFVFLSGIISYQVRFYNVKLPINIMYEILISALIIVVIFQKYDLYHKSRRMNITKMTCEVFKCWTLWVLVLCLISFFTKTSNSISRLWAISFSCSVLLIFILQRVILIKTLYWLRSKGINQKSILFIGSDSEKKDLEEHLRSQTWSGLQIGSFLNMKALKLFKQNELDEYLKKQEISEIWIGISIQSSKTSSKYLKELQTSCLQIRLIPFINNSNINLINQSITEVASLPVINLRISPLFGFNKFIKYLEDKVLSLLILILISPIMLIIATLIKLTSKGPIFYKQKRISCNGSSFNILKFRSMPIDSEKQTGAVWATKKDNRATKFGSFLRKTSLDELPQFINVLKGDMSIVGPRPERPIFVDKFKSKVPGYMHKHLIKAGITGWAQINGWRGNTDIKKRIEHDLYYIDNWSLILDIKIIILTAFKGFYNKNAY